MNISEIMSQRTRGAVQPEVGMGATTCVGSDRYAHTVIDVTKVGKHTYVTVQSDKSELVSGSAMTESQEYVFTMDPNGSRMTFRQDPKGGWEQVKKNTQTGRWNKTGTRGLYLGERDEYRDPCF